MGARFTPLNIPASATGPNLSTVPPSPVLNLSLLFSKTPVLSTIPSSPWRRLGTGYWEKFSDIFRNANELYVMRDFSILLVLYIYDGNRELILR